MSKHKYSRDADLVPGTTPTAPRDATARAAILNKYGVKKMAKKCTAENCNVLGKLHDDYAIAQNERRFSDALKIWNSIQAHECAK